MLVEIDGNYMLHRAFHGATRRYNKRTIEKNTVTSAVSSICSILLLFKSTNCIVCFDGSASFRKEISKLYKANRRKNGTEIKQFDGSKILVKETPGSFIDSAKAALDFLGIKYAHKKHLEADDLMAGAARNYEGECIIVTRDKDLARCVNDRVKLYWPVEKKLIDEEEVFKHFGVKPKQIGDYLCLLGDKVDNIEGLDRWGPKTCAKFLLKYGSIKKALDTKDGKKLLRPHLKKLVLAKKLVSLDYSFVAKDTKIKFTNDVKIPSSLWRIPESYELLNRRFSSLKIKKLYV